MAEEKRTARQPRCRGFSGPPTVWISAGVHPEAEPRQIRLRRVQRTRRIIQDVRPETERTDVAKTGYTRRTMSRASAGVSSPLRSRRRLYILALGLAAAPTSAKNPFFARRSVPNAASAASEK